ncbi:MAG: hypothetical protein AAF921_13295 [Cyanobacteria bacterium P01_D01_bin.44]
MQVADLVTNLTQQGVQLWVDQDKLKINAPKGVMTSQLRADLAARKTEVLSFLRQPRGCKTAAGLSLETLGRLLGGGGKPGTHPSAFRPPVIESGLMAQQLKVTLRPLPEPFADQTILAFREELEQQLLSYGVQMVPWSAATRDFQAKGPLGKTPLRVVKSDINAVIDVERPVSRFKSCLAEHVYQLYARFLADRPSVAQISQLTGWAEDHAMHRLEDPTATQVILITPLDETFVDAEVPYAKKIAMGVNTLVSGFSEIVIGVSRERLSILNMNLSDSLFDRSQLGQFVSKSLIPKIYVPISPLPLSQFEVSEYAPTQSDYAHQLVKLSQALAKTDLFPSGFKLGEVIRRQSHRDIVDAIVNGRTGVSYGFVAYAEPPQYVGAQEISAAKWDQLLPVERFSAEDLRQTVSGRWYVKTPVQGQVFYRQIPDIWMVCSRSGADKTNLNLTQDILRLGLTGHLQLQLPMGSDAGADIKPSYDTYVMVAIALSAALYTPELIQDGAPIIHFHGYPARDWFSEHEAYAGVENPSVPCGTYESGVFNFLSIHQLAERGEGPLKLAGLVEPDHGINLIAPDLDYLLTRLTEGLQHQQIELGGNQFASLTAKEPVGGPTP